MALNTLAEHLSTLPDEAKVIFGFDGSVFSIRSDGEVVALAGQGTPWTVSFHVRVGALRHLPRRLMRERIEVSMWESHIDLGNGTYAGTLEGVDTSSRVQCE